MDLSLQASHTQTTRLQVSLYLMLMEDRYQQPCDMGLLWNINEGTTMQPVQRVHGELAALMMHRCGVRACACVHMVMQWILLGLRGL